MAALPDPEEMFDRLAVQVGRVHAAEHLEDFGKSLKPNKLATQCGCPLLLDVSTRTGIMSFPGYFRPGGR